LRRSCFSTGGTRGKKRNNTSAPIIEAPPATRPIVAALIPKVPEIEGPKISPSEIAAETRPIAAIRPSSVVASARYAWAIATFAPPSPASTRLKSNPMRLDAAPYISIAPAENRVQISRIGFRPTSWRHAPQCGETTN